ncbi:MAG: tRNA (adenosine(37)-N6)-dimethylallyltransferase MiaA [Clostridia bacterium]|nr:tRNA (adenosine(37)-N6)-dimethylallyltransferase MiaA [Clostridia bacterium]
MLMKKLIAIVGTNASGKSGLGVRLASRFGGEIISADSRQVFTGLDLGSGKIKPEEMMGVPHHLLDVCAPNDFYSMADFQKQAYEAIDDVLARGKQPFLVGGTGLYVASVTEGYLLSDKTPNLEYRNELEKLSTPELYDMLIKAVPDIDIDRNNRNRVMRVLEKIEAGDDAIPSSEKKYDTIKIGVSWDRETLKRRIDERLARRVKEGMIKEVQTLLDNGASVQFMMKLGLEYRFITQYLTGEIKSLDEMLDDLSKAIKKFAKRQMTWFKRDPEIHWLDMTGNPDEEAAELIVSFLSR